MKTKKLLTMGILAMAMALTACGSREDGKKEDVSEGMTTITPSEDTAAVETEVPTAELEVTEVPVAEENIEDATSLAPKEDGYYSMYIVGDIEIDVYLDKELCYYLHHKGDDLEDVKQGKDFTIRYIGTWDYMPAMMLYFKNANYKVDIHSSEEQKIEFVLDTDTIDYALEKYEIGKDETLEISLNDGKPEIAKDGKLIEPIVVNH